MASQLAQALPHQQPGGAGADTDQLGPVVGKVHDLQGARVFDQALDVVGDDLLGADDHVDGQVAIAEEIVPMQVFPGADPGDPGGGVKQQVGHLAGDHVDLIAVGHRHQHVGGIGPGAEQVVGVGGVADHGAHVQALSELVQALAVGVDHGDVAGFAGQLLGEAAPYLSRAQDDDFHGCPRCFPRALQRRPAAPRRRAAAFAGAEFAQPRSLRDNSGLFNGFYLPAPLQEFPMPAHRELANAIRALSMDAVQQANSGHPGAPMGMADIAEVLWRSVLRHNPANPHWANRDRFVLSNGHGSMLLYALLHLTGYDLSIDDLKRFRQLGSATAGHPEYGYAPGIETTTGPLGQGLANAVGMAIAEKVLAAQFNRPGHEIIDHHTYVFVGDGCLMEGISHEVCSLAGTLKLDKLIGFYDDNGISIDGKVQGWFTDDTPARFEAYGWHVVRDVDGHDAEAVQRAIEEAHSVTDRPSLICCKTIIGYGAPNAAGTHGVHGAPLGANEITASRDFLKWPHAPFEVPAEIYQAYDARAKGSELEQAWQGVYEQYKARSEERRVGRGRR